jgi:hypothetical protein
MRGEVSPVLVLAGVVAEGIFDPLAVDLVPAVDALGVDPVPLQNSMQGP